ncbi:MAG TPA: nitronate monooxygenase family protein [Dehalococcoidia bacterium]|nr:nitronate monooxygenase family protein [Dehalococcoidia bacterium]
MMAHDPLHTKFCDMFGLEFPVIAFTHCKDVVVAVTNAGGLGVMGEVGRTPEEIEQDVRWIRERVGEKAFGVDLLFPASIPPKANLEDLQAQIPEEHRKFVRQIKEKYNVPDPKREGARMRGGGMMSQEHARRQLDVVLEERVPLFASGLGNPAFIVEAAHERGIKVAGLIGKVRQARREIEAGVDFIIAQGYDAGGHTGEIGTFTLVPQVAAIAGDTPVILAGGVGTGKHLAAALCLGAQGVWTGTIWLTARESDTDMIVKEKILAATEEDTLRSRCMTGKPVRQLKTQWTEEWESPGAPSPLPMPLQGILTGDLMLAIGQYKIEPLMGSPAGQVVGTIHEMKPARDIVFDIIEEARDVLDGLAGEPVTA